MSDPLLLFSDLTYYTDIVLLYLLQKVALEDSKWQRFTSLLLLFGCQ
jgi:hypothetical protein